MKGVEDCSRDLAITVRIGGNSTGLILVNEKYRINNMNTMNTIGWWGLVIAAMIFSAISLAGCSGVQMEVDESPGPQPQELGYNLTVGEPTTGEVFDDMYCIGTVSEVGGEAGFTIPNQTEKIRSLNVFREEDGVMIEQNRFSQEEFDEEGDFSLQTLIYPEVTKYRYRVEALNESGAVIDAVAITIAEN